MSDQFVGQDKVVSFTYSIQDESGVTPVPCASLMLLMLGPGTKITHAAALTSGNNGGQRLYQGALWDIL